MAIISADDSGLHSDALANYLDRSDPRVVTGFRVALEVLGIPLPVAALRKQAGRPPISSFMSGFHADNPDIARADKARKLGMPNAFDPLNS